MLEIDKAAHTRFYMRYHIVWIVKRRKDVLVGRRVQRLVEILKEVGELYEMELEEIGVDEDHVHIFCKGMPSMLASRQVQILKSISAREMLKGFPELKIMLRGAGMWGVGYYLATVGYASNAQAVRGYVRNQGKNKKVNYSQLALFV